MLFFGFFVCSSIFITNSWAVDEQILYAEDTLEDEYGKIIYSSLLFRHGDRYISTPYPTDPNPVSVWTEGIGQLTKEGKQCMYDLGKWFQKRYQELIPDGKYRYDRIKMNSSEMDRTMMSAELVLAGQFPPGQDEKWTDDNYLRWQPIPVHIVPDGYDYIVGANAPCERYDLEKSILNRSPDLQALYEKHQDLFKYAAEYSGFNMSSNDIYTSYKNLATLYDNLFVEDLYNLSIPQWARKIFPEPLRTISEMYFELLTYSDEMKRLHAGPLLGVMIQEMQQKRKETTFNQTIHLYSVHDVVVAPFLDTLGVYNKIAPPYSATVLLELRKRGDEYIITVLYKNSTTNPPYLLEIPGCQDICTLDKFAEITESLIPDDWWEECKVGFLEKQYRLHFVYLILFACLILAVIVIIFVIIRLLCVQRIHEKHYALLKNTAVNYQSCDEHSRE